MCQICFRKKINKINCEQLFFGVQLVMVVSRLSQIRDLKNRESPQLLQTVKLDSFSTVKRIALFVVRFSSLFGPNSAQNLNLVTSV